MIATELSLARSGALDANLISNQAFYGTNCTKPLLFLEDGEYFAQQASAQHLTGSQWGVMNETGSYPGQPWLWLYTLWYQVPGFDNSANVDLIAIYMTGAAHHPAPAPAICARLPRYPRGYPSPPCRLAELEQPEGRLGGGAGHGQSTECMSGDLKCERDGKRGATEMTVRVGINGLGGESGLRRRRLERTGSSIVGGLPTPESAGSEKLLDPGQPVVELGQPGLCRSRAGRGVFMPPPGGLLDEAR